jgi:Arc/MetJ-type ribon-helix-helix transcriptional regulator
MENNEQTSKTRRRAGPLSKPLSIRLSEKCLSELKALVQQGAHRTYADAIAAAVCKALNEDTPNTDAPILALLNTINEKVDKLSEHRIGQDPESSNNKRQLDPETFDLLKSYLKRRRKETADYIAQHGRTRGVANTVRILKALQSLINQEADKQPLD